MAKTATPLSLSDLAESAEFSDEPIVTTRSRTSKFAENPLRETVRKARESGQTVTLRPMPGEMVPEALGYLRAAAKESDHGIKFQIPKNYAELDSVVVRFQATDKKNYSPRTQTGKTSCPVCNSETAVTGDGKVRVHGPRSNRCPGSGVAA